MTDDFSILKIQQLGQQIPSAGGQCLIQIPQGKYDLSRCRVQISFQCNTLATNRVLSRADCYVPVSNAQIQHDGLLIGTFQNLAISQYQWYYKHVSENRGQAQVYQDADNNFHNLARAKKSVQILGLGTGANAIYTISLSFKHFFAGLFDNIDILHVKQQLSCTLNITPTLKTAFTQARGRSILDLGNAVAGNSYQIAQIDNTIFTLLLCSPQQAIVEEQTTKHFIMQYQGSNAESLTYTFVPQSNSILTGIGMCFSRTNADVVGFGEDQLDLDAVNQKITINGFQIVNSIANQKGDFTSQMMNLRGDDCKQDSCSDEAIIPVKYANSQVQVNVNLGHAAQQFITFYETMLM